MDHVQLETAIKSDFLLSKCCRGVFSADETPVLYPGECAIINRDVSSGKGEHWTAFGVLLPAEARELYSVDENIVVGEFFCSFGVFDYESIKTRLQPSCNIIYCNPVKLQTDFLHSCGSFALYWVWCFSRQVHMRDFLTRFFSSMFALTLMIGSI